MFTPSEVTDQNNTMHATDFLVSYCEPVFIQPHTHTHLSKMGYPKVNMLELLTRFEEKKVSIHINGSCVLLY